MIGQELGSFNAAYLLQDATSATNRYLNRIETNYWNDANNLTLGEPHWHAQTLLAEKLARTGSIIEIKKAEKLLSKAAMKRYPRALFNLAKFDSLRSVYVTGSDVDIHMMFQ